MPNVSNGLKLELRPRSSSYSEGELPSFDAVLTNISAAPVIFCAYKATHRLLSTMHADGWEVKCFQPTPKDSVGSEDFVTLAPGASTTFALELPKVAAQGYRVLWAGSQSPVINESQAAKGFPSGSFHFKAHLGDCISFYTASPGQCGPRERVHIVKDVPKSVPVPSQVWSGDVVGECQVTFG